DPTPCVSPPASTSRAPGGPDMLAMVRLRAEVFEDPALMVALVDLAAEHELILVYADDAPASVVSTLRLLLRRYRLVSLLVDSCLLRHEIDLIGDVVADGAIPVLLMMRDTIVADSSRRLGADADFAFP